MYVSTRRTVLIDANHLLYDAACQEEVAQQNQENTALICKVFPHNDCESNQLEPEYQLKQEPSGLPSALTSKPALRCCG